MHAAAVDQAWERVRARLLAGRDPRGWWEGRLSSSALATAVASCGLARSPAPGHAALAARGRAWLEATANADGGWGDTPDSPSNLPTTLLGWAACGGAAAERWIAAAAGGTDASRLRRALDTAYGDDLSFTAPLLALLARCGRLGPEPGCWDEVAQLPVELVAVPRGAWRLLRLGVVSYALPALIAVGLLRHRRAGGGARAWLRERLVAAALRRLEAMWPAGRDEAGRPTGGFNEAPPLVGFVYLGLEGAGLGHLPVARRCADYLAAWMREDGSWSVEAHLRTWCTSLAVAALAGDGGDPAWAGGTRTWLLACQRTAADPTTGAAPGGWAWNELPGAMPDGDDTAGALVALRLLDGDPAAAAAGCAWLAGIQNADGGIPTFCRGWGRLPFDRSCPDLTAHALRAWGAWLPALPPAAARRIRAARARALGWLLRSQRGDGAWLPLWFGNQAAPAQDSPVFGTAQVLLALDGLEGGGAAHRRGADWLAAAQGGDGGWGAAATVEETALAVAALAGTAHHAAAERGAAWLLERTAGGTRFPAAPIGLYFARLWYAQELYPLAWSLLALSRLRAARRTKAK